MELGPEQGTFPCPHPCLSIIRLVELTHALSIVSFNSPHPRNSPRGAGIPSLFTDEGEGSLREGQGLAQSCRAQTQQSCHSDCWAAPAPGRQETPHIGWSLADAVDRWGPEAQKPNPGEGLGGGGRTLERKPRSLFSPVTCSAPPSNGKCVSEEAAGWGRGRCAWVTACGGPPRGAGCAGAGGQGWGCWSGVRVLPPALCLFLSGSHFLHRGKGSENQGWGHRG